MPKRIDRNGQRYGRLTVIEFAGKDHRGKVLWLCKCDCGNEKIITSDSLSSRKSNSCGCLRKEFLSNPDNHFEREKNREKAILKVQYSHIKRRNKKLNEESVFSFEEFVEKSKMPCFYCGLKYSKILQDRQSEMKDGKLVSDTVVKINVIDRIDSNKGYTSDNTVPCCKICNTAKNTMSQQEFMDWIKRVYYFSIAKERIEKAKGGVE